MKSLYWFTNDLRIYDNPGLNQALQSGDVLPIYILDTSNTWPIQGASAWWLHNSLRSLLNDLSILGHDLQLHRGDALSILKKLTQEHSIQRIYCARNYFPYERKLQKSLSLWCHDHGIEFKRFGGSLLLEPEQVQNKQGSFFKVFTPFSKYYTQQTLRSATPTKSSQQNHYSTITSGNNITSKAKITQTHIQTLNALNLLPTHPDWSAKICEHWQPGEEGAHKTLKNTIESIVHNYNHDRDQLGHEGTSKLSAHLRFGELSPAQVWQEIAKVKAPEESFPFLRQLLWREFNYHLLFHRPEIDQSCFNEKFNIFPWTSNNHYLERWQHGQTGYPVVDAAMQQLWQTGWMHNRARMIVASFLTKHLLIPWQEGARWFWDTLVDADLANNAAGWQWTAGCGADASPYFRIFNPITQGEKFDPKGNYVRHWLPQLSKLPNKYLFKPWDAPEHILNEAEITLGETYPKPIVIHMDARKKALDAYQRIQG